MVQQMPRCFHAALLPHYNLHTLLWQQMKHLHQQLAKSRIITIQMNHNKDIQSVSQLSFIMRN